MQGIQRDSEFNHSNTGWEKGISIEMARLLTFLKSIRNNYLDLKIKESII